VQARRRWCWQKYADPLLTHRVDEWKSAHTTPRTRLSLTPAKGWFWPAIASERPLWGMRYYVRLWPVSDTHRVHLNGRSRGIADERARNRHEGRVKTVRSPSPPLTGIALSNRP
jgi:hypothetical protein